MVCECDDGGAMEGCDASGQVKQNRTQRKTAPTTPQTNTTLMHEFAPQPHRHQHHHNRRTENTHTQRTGNKSDTQDQTASDAQRKRPLGSQARCQARQPDQHTGPRPRQAGPFLKHPPHPDPPTHSPSLHIQGDSGTVQRGGGGFVAILSHRSGCCHARCASLYRRARLLSLTGGRWRCSSWRRSPEPVECSPCAGEARPTALPRRFQCLHHPGTQSARAAALNT
jgi:hypothetical protein